MREAQCETGWGEPRMMTEICDSTLHPTPDDFVVRPSHSRGG
jgi:hypothetical protein